MLAVEFEEPILRAHASISTATHKPPALIAAAGPIGSLGSVQALAQDLDRSGIRTRQRRLANGRIIAGGGAFGVGALAYLLRNRFYVGDVVYRGEIFRGIPSRSSIPPCSRPCRKSSPSRGSNGAADRYPWRTVRRVPHLAGPPDGSYA
jgi:hypothetical protein